MVVIEVFAWDANLGTGIWLTVRRGYYLSGSHMRKLKVLASPLRHQQSRERLSSRMNILTGQTLQLVSNDSLIRASPVCRGYSLKSSNQSCEDYS